MSTANPEHAFPEKGRSRDEVLAALMDHKSRDLVSDGRAFAFVYDAGASVRELAREAYAACMPINGLDPTVYPSARKIENAVVAACLEITSAPEGACGTATAGGTESVMLAVKSARDYARKTRPEITQPKMLLPVTAHACFHKAAAYLGVEVVSVGVDPTSFRADVADAERKMSEDVILVVGSAPSYAHGVVDPIEGLAKLARESGALMHVDACVGGCVLPFMRMNGESVPQFDFSVPGVTSLSMDLHKYGFAPKGVSVLLQRRRELRDAQYFACAKWTGYTIVNSTTLGSKSVSAMGAAFALLHHLGKEGYRERAARMWSATKHLVSVVRETPGLRMLGAPDMNLFAFTTEGGDVFELADRLTERGWHVQPTYAFGPSPAHIHLTLDPGNSERAPDFGRDLRECMQGLPASQEPPAQVVQLLESIGLGGGEALDSGMLMQQLGISDGQLPSRSAIIHRLINAASPAARERLLVLFIGELFS
ncbi:MAG: aspartate aminotransferase family protein [Sandaracinaceae bacterium]|nr:aspartate aminotransferase family protein [Sandaracinaceae bacterium]